MNNVFELSGEQSKVYVPAEPTPQELEVARNSESDFTTLLELKTQLKNLQDVHDLVETRIIETFQKYGVQGVKANDVQYTLVSGNTKVYDRDDDVKIAEEELKLLKAEKEKKGLVTLKPKAAYLKISR